MIYSFSLQTVGFVVASLLILGHGFAIIRPESVKGFLKQFPRSRSAGIVLISLATVWAFWLTATMDLGEFSNFRKPILILLPIAAYLVIRFVDEFLSVRALGILLLLAVEVLLESAFLRPEISRLLLVVLAYLWAIAGLFWVGLPYLLRNLIARITSCNRCWRVMSSAGLIYGIVLFIAAFWW